MLAETAIEQQLNSYDDTRPKSLKLTHERGRVTRNLIGKSSNNINISINIIAPTTEMGGTTIINQV